MDEKVWAVEHETKKTTESLDMPGLKWDKTVEWEKTQMVGGSGMGQSFSQERFAEPEFEPVDDNAFYDAGADHTRLMIGHTNTGYCFALDFLARINKKYENPLFSDKDIEDIANAVAERSENTALNR